MPTIATDPGVDELIERLAGEENGRFDRAISDPLQEAINATDDPEAARECVRRAAGAAHARLPQYEEHWSGDEWQIGVIGTRVRTKLGIAFEEGDTVLYKQRRGYDRAETTAYSIRNSIDTAVRVYVRPFVEAAVEVVPMQAGPPCIAGKYYLVNQARNQVVAGPHDSASAAARDRRAGQHVAREVAQR